MASNGPTALRPDHGSPARRLRRLGAVVGTNGTPRRPTSPMRRPLRALAALAVLALPSVSLADGTTLRADLVEGKSIKVDGVLKEWGALVNLGYTLKGKPVKGDLQASAALAYDAKNLYVGADVTTTSSGARRRPGRGRPRRPGRGTSTMWSCPRATPARPPAREARDGKTLARRQGRRGPEGTAGRPSRRASRGPRCRGRPGRACASASAASVRARRRRGGSTRPSSGPRRRAAYASLPRSLHGGRAVAPDGLLLEEKGIRGAPRQVQPHCRRRRRATLR